MSEAYLQRQSEIEEEELRKLKDLVSSILPLRIGKDWELIPAEIRYATLRTLLEYTPILLTSGTLKEIVQDLGSIYTLDLQLVYSQPIGDVKYVIPVNRYCAQELRETGRHVLYASIYPSEVFREYVQQLLGIEGLRTLSLYVRAGLEGEPEIYLYSISYGTRRSQSLDKYDARKLGILDKYEMLEDYLRKQLGDLTSLIAQLHRAILLRVPVTDI